jgi:hypothetical protein
MSARERKGTTHCGGVPLPLPGPSPSLLARGMARFAETRGQPLDPAEGHGPSDSLTFSCGTSYGKMFRDASISFGYDSFMRQRGGNID